MRNIVTNYYFNTRKKTRNISEHASSNFQFAREKRGEKKTFFKNLILELGSRLTFDHVNVITSF